MKLIQITDLHLVADGQELFGLDPRLRLRACIADINAHHRDAELCVITGDLTHYGDEASYGVLREELSCLELPWQLLIGNHDNRQNFRHSFPEMPVDAHGFVQTSWESPEGRILFLDSLEQGLHSGSYCERRLAWLESQLSDLDDRPVHIFMHHPPVRIGFPSLDNVGLMQREVFEALLRKYQANVRHVFFGHVHRPVSISWNGIGCTAIRGTAHQCWFDLKVQEQPLGSHEAPAYGVIIIDGDSTIIHAHDFLDQSRRFPLQGRPVGERTQSVDGVEGDQAA